MTPLVPTRTRTLVPSGTEPSCHRGPRTAPKPPPRRRKSASSNVSNQDSFGVFLTRAALGGKPRVWRATHRPGGWARRRPSPRRSLAGHPSQSPRPLPDRAGAMTRGTEDLHPRRADLAGEADRALDPLRPTPRLSRSSIVAAASSASRRARSSPTSAGPPTTMARPSRASTSCAP